MSWVLLLALCSVAAATTREDAAARIAAAQESDVLNQGAEGAELIANCEASLEASAALSLRAACIALGATEAMLADGDTMLAAGTEDQNAGVADDQDVGSPKRKTALGLLESAEYWYSHAPPMYSACVFYSNLAIFRFGESDVGFNAAKAHYLDAKTHFSAARTYYSGLYMLLQM